MSIRESTILFLFKQELTIARLADSAMFRTRCGIYTYEATGIAVSRWVLSK